MEETLLKLEVYQIALKISDLSYGISELIPKRHLATSGQFLRAADSIGANIAEGYGRGTFRDRQKFMVIARDSLYETNFWLSRIETRGLAEQELIEAMKMLCASEARLIYGYIKYLKTKI
ncbi:MAG: four helix bundle protein [Bacteroidales bacterium]